MPPWSDDDVTALVAELAPHGLGRHQPGRDAAARPAGWGAGRPLQFVNLLAYHAIAAYPEGHELAGAGLSGAEAYGRYGAVALDHVARRGGALTLYNDVVPRAGRPRRRRGTRSR